MFVIYGLAFSTLALCMAALYARAWKLRRALGLDDYEHRATAAAVATWAWAFVVGLSSIVCAVLMPEHPPFWLAGLPGMMYFLMNLSGTVARLAERRVRRQLAQGAT
jgi:hypothetical protein